MVYRNFEIVSLPDGQCSARHMEIVYDGSRDKVMARIDNFWLERCILRLKAIYEPVKGFADAVPLTAENAKIVASTHDDPDVLKFLAEQLLTEMGEI
jgi:hypothetical protein